MKNLKLLLMPKYKLMMFIFCVCLSKADIVFSQVNNTELEQEILVCDSLERNVLFSIANQNYLRNNEYFHDITTGYTLFGSLLSAQAAYLPTKNLRIQAGLFFRKDFGNPVLKSVEPLLTLKYQKNGFSLLVGNLEGNLSHRVIEPMFNYERYFTHYNENGLQVKFDRKKVWSDTWINWEVMQYNNSDFQEEFAAGNSTQYHLLQDKRNKLDMHFQGIITHIGGQVDIDTNAIQSKVNMAVGFSYARKYYSIVRELSTQNYYTIYKELGLSKLQTITEGSGIYLNATVKTKFDLSLMASYWDGKTYLAPRGGDLFQSLSSEYVKTGVLEPRRQLIFVRLLYQKKVVDHFYVDVRFEPYVDLRNKFFEHAQAIYLTYRNDFSLIQTKKRKTESK